MKDDPIMAELWAVRNQMAARFDYDVDAFFRYIREQESKSGLHYVECPPRKLTAVRNGSVEPSSRDD